jgi:hypothetical protein
MSKRIIISETEKNQIKSLYQLNERRTINILNGQTFQINIGGGPRTYKINKIYTPPGLDDTFVIDTIQEKTGIGDNKGSRVFALGDKYASKEFVFMCRVGYLGGYNESEKDYIGTENYEDLEINEKFCQYFCQNYNLQDYPDSQCNKN